MSNSTSSAVQYSQGHKNIGTAKNFSWEYPVPNNEFWSPLGFVVGRNFLKCFTEAEIHTMEPRLDSSLSNDEKYELLMKLLEEKLEAGDGDKRLYETNYQQWDGIWLGIATMRARLGMDDEETIRMLVERRKDKTNLSHLHNLSAVLLKKGKYAEAEEKAEKVKEWLDGKLGRDSPQALGSRKIIAQAVWKQGRVEEAKGKFKEMEELVVGGMDGTYGVYMEEQEEILRKAIKDLEGETEGCIT